MVSVPRPPRGFAFAFAAMLVLFHADAAFGCTMREGAYHTAMVSDLRNLVTAQEAYASTHKRYAANFTELDSTFFRPSFGVTVTFTPTATGFTAATTHAATTNTCSLGVTGGAADSLAAPDCTRSMADIHATPRGAFVAMIAIALALMGYGAANFGSGRGAGMAAVLVSMGLALGVTALLARHAGCGMGIILPLSAMLGIGVLVGIALLATSGIGALAKKAARG